MKEGSGDKPLPSFFIQIKMVKKTYMYAGATSVTTIFTVKNKRRIVNFEGGSTIPIKINAKFTTADKDLQNAIEASPKYGKFIFLENAYDMVETKPVVNENVDGFKSYANVTRLQDAKNILNRDFDIPFSGLKNKEDILKASHEVKATFPDLN